MKKTIKKENFAVRWLKGIGYGIFGEVLCIFLVMSLIVIARGHLWIKILVSVFALFLTLGLYFNWAFKAANSDRSIVKFHDAEYDRFMPLKMALTGPIVSYLSLVVLFISKLGIIPDIFRFYLLGNMFVMPFVDAYTEGRTIGDVSWLGFAGITLLVLSQGITVAVSYILTYREVDIIKLVMYKKDKNK